MFKCDQSFLWRTYFEQVVGTAVKKARLLLKKLREPLHVCPRSFVVGNFVDVSVGRKRQKGRGALVHGGRVGGKGGGKVTGARIETQGAGRGKGVSGCADGGEDGICARRAVWLTPVPSRRGG